jgi:uncharacterized protein (TIGR03032 family)
MAIPPGARKKPPQQKRVPKKEVQCSTDQGFFEWMHAHQVGMAISTYQAGKLLFIGWNGQSVSLHARNFDKAMGIDVLDQQLAIATTDKIHLFSNDALLAPACVPDQPDRYDSLYLLRASFNTGYLFTHDLAFVGEELWFVNTRFSCLATLDPRYSFVPRWQPNFISELSPHDRCHLNGMAVDGGKVRSVTALGTTDTARGWTADKVGGGVVIDVDSHEILLRNLSMPHSPRWHNGHLWVLDSGKGELLRLNVGQGTADSVCALQGYLRGLTFVGDYAIVGLCKIREKRVFGGLPVEQRVENLLCGIAIIDTRSGEQVGFFEFTDGVEEIYDIRILPHGYSNPNLLNWEQPRLKEAISTPGFSYWIETQPDKKPDEAAAQKPANN